LSGVLRRFAFRYSESNLGHWLPLMLADRVATFEGIFGDLIRGRVPNFFAERGGRAEWRFNRTSLVLRTLVRLIIFAAIVATIVFLVVRE
jgi:hypothetical protein